MRFQVSKPVLAGQEKEYVLDAIDSGWISSNGPYIARFERLLDEFLGVEGVIAVCNGTAALHVAYLGLGLAAGQEVIVPTLTYVATANAVTYCGARPVFAECDRESWNVSLATIAAAWSSRTVGVSLVHLYGRPAPIEEIAALARARGAWLLEDCAESLGATWRGKATGTFGDASMFSFYGNKTISTGEGGAVYLREARRREVARMLRGQGMDPRRRYWHPVIGYNYRMTNIAAAIGVGQMERVEHHLAERRRIAAAYAMRLRSLAAEGLLQLPGEDAGSVNSHWLYSIVLAGGGAPRRARIQEHLAARGIETRPFFVPMHQLPMYRGSERFPVAERIADHGLNLPTYTGLSDRDIDEICDGLSDAVTRTAEVR
ncbi:MAG TPA: DegT/DnrJ/EryC1/StrS family aminotransferase [Stellaceae bacterium]|nr:DegT/DnrJ/EryC1/StrS family aminotransferase [Stellaceae bacterium]